MPTRGRYTKSYRNLKQHGLTGLLIERLRELYPVDHEFVTLVREGESADEALERFWRENPSSDFCLTLNIRNPDAASLPDEPALPVYTNPVESSEPEKKGVVDPNEAFREAIRRRDELLSKKKAKPDDRDGWSLRDWALYFADVDESQWDERAWEYYRRLSNHPVGLPDSLAWMR